MNGRIILALLIVMSIGNAHLAAGSVRQVNRASLTNVDNLVIDQRGLRQFMIGVSIMPVKTRICGWDGDDLIVTINGKTAFGIKNPISVMFSDNGKELVVAISYDYVAYIGVNIGSIEISVQIPDTWTAALTLKDLRTPTQIDGLSIRDLSGNTSLTRLNISDSRFDTVRLSLGADSDFTAIATSAAIWNVEGGVGKISAVGGSGEMNIETLEGAISVEFSDFRGASTFHSKMGMITIGIPADTQLTLDISSSIDSVETDLPVVGFVAENSPNRIKGAIGTSANSLSAHSGSEKVRVMAKMGSVK